MNKRFFINPEKFPKITLKHKGLFLLMMGFSWIIYRYVLLTEVNYVYEFIITYLLGFLSSMFIWVVR